MESKLRDDFPVDWDEDNYVSRREFFKFMTLASGGLAVGSVVLAGLAQIPRDKISFEAAKIAAVGDVPVGGFLAFTYPRPEDICILIHSEQDKFVAFSRRCTHLSCPVEYQPQNSRIFCPCHNGAFSLEDGRVLQGPPPRPLPRILLDIRDGQIYATGVAKAEA